MTTNRTLLLGFLYGSVAMAVASAITGMAAIDIMTIVVLPIIIVCAAVCGGFDDVPITLRRFWAALLSIVGGGKGPTP